MLPRIFPPDNSPESLLKIVVKYIVSNDIPIKYVSLPTEICNTLLEVFRDLNANNPSNTNDPGKVTRFISQFRADSTPLSVAKLSNLPITDRDLLHLLCEHHNTLKYLDIDGCRDLTENSFPTLLTLSSRLDNYDRLIVNVKLTEQDGERQDASMVSPSSSSVEGSDLICFSDSLEDISHDGDSVKTYSYSKALLDKKYERGVITSNLGICESTHVGYKQDLLSIFEAMDVFQYGFEQLRRDLSSINEDSGLISDVTDSQRIDMNETPQKIFYHSESSPCERIRLSNTSNQEPTISSYILSTFEFPEINSGHLVEKTSTGKFRHLKYQTYRLPPLETLIIGSSNIFPRAREWKRLVNKEKIDPHLPLKAFVLHGPDPHSSQFISDSILDLIVSSSMNQTLTYLDLSSCGALTISSPLKLENLKTLILYNTQISLSCLKSLKKLRYLDISTSFERQAHSYESPDSTLAELVTSLPELTHLDISGTNLTGERSNRIVGLESRYNRPLEFLGVYNTANDGSFRHCLPALRVAGEATEEHILTACEVYMDRSEFLTKALNDLFHCFRHESEFHDIVRSLNCVLTAMERHLEEKPIQIAASASLFYMVKSEDAKNYSPLMKRPIVSRLLDAMHRFQNDSTMLRNGSLTMIHFKLPHDVLFEYPRVVKLLLFIVMNEEEEFIQRLGIYLLNSLVCHVDRGQKTLVGDLGAIEKLVKLIRNKLAKNQCDEVMEIAWSTIWNVTDENPTNCERFLDNLGMDLFVRCMEAFPDPPDLLRNMMGLLGNVAECKTLRPRLMEADYITRFSNLLASESDGIEVSYNAAGILSHIVSDGEEVWNQLLSKTDRADILYRMRMAIGRWQINSRRNINYRSFEPILRLLKTEKPVYEAQYWAVWALANLTRVYSPKYCPLLIADGGVKILETLLQDKQLPSHVRKLAVLTLQQIELWKRYASLGALENSTSIEIDLNRC